MLLGLVSRDSLLSQLNICLPVDDFKGSFFFKIRNFLPTLPDKVNTHVISLDCMLVDTKDFQFPTALFLSNVFFVLV